jgi:heme exporter protein A
MGKKTNNKLAVPDQGQPQLQVEELTCRRGERLLFENINFTVNSGDTFEISGHNGSGKTTLLRLLCGLLLPEKGKLLWRGQPIHKVRPLYHSELAYVGHTDAIKGDLTTHENLIVAKALNGGGINSEEALERVGLSKLRELPGRFLSAGQRRRLALARLLVNRARLWLLDEPFTALDKVAIKTIATLLEEHAANGGMAVFTSHHTINIAHARTLEISSALA